jgi:hypothetical protein
VYSYFAFFLSRFVRLAAAANGVEDMITTLPWTWGEWTAEVLSLPTPDLIIASDCLYARSGW